MTHTQTKNNPTSFGRLDSKNKVIPEI